jgi:hypothetical protein
MSFALVAAVALAGSALAQTAAQTPATPPATSAPAASPPAGGKERLSHACKEEVKKACGRAHGDEMQNCIKSSLDLNKFSDSCKTELKSAKPSG